MRLVFAGTPAFAAAALEALAAAGHVIVGVLTQPDRQAGRGLALRASAVKACAVARGLPVAQPASLREATAQAELARLAPDLMVVAAYGLLLPPAVLAMPRLGCVNIHASLLPRWRGAAPIQRALLAGDTETGITLMQMEAGLDTGPMLVHSRVAIDAEDTGGTLHDKLALQGAHDIVALLARPEGWPTPVPQDERQVTYAAKITARDAGVAWMEPAEQIARQVRAFDPAPGTVALLEGTPVKIWKARPVPASGPIVAPGTIVAITPEAIVVGCGTGALAITELQRAGGRRLSAPAFAAGARLAVGQRFDARPA
ncbi:MAG: methionyl-tRNA formyltransferase [Burkholderiales bacterium]